MSFVPVGYLNTSINRASRRTTIPQLCFNVRLCQKILDQFHHFLLAAAQGGISCESWSVDEHDPFAIQLKLVGRSDFVVQSCLQTRPASVVDELQLQPLESENRSDRLPSLPSFFQSPYVLPHWNQGLVISNAIREIVHVRDKRGRFPNLFREALCHW